MIALNSTEQDEFDIIDAVIQNAPSNTTLVFPSSFFSGRTASPRLARRLYEEVVNGRYKNILKLNGTTSREGYIKI